MLHLTPTHLLLLDIAAIGLGIAVLVIRCSSFCIRRSHRLRCRVLADARPSEISLPCCSPRHQSRQVVQQGRDCKGREAGQACWSLLPSQ